MDFACICPGRQLPVFGDGRDPGNAHRNILAAGRVLTSCLFVSRRTVPTSERRSYEEMSPVLTIPTLGRKRRFVKIYFQDDILKQGLSIPGLSKECRIAKPEL